MTTLATGLLPETLQSLVDARLDTIDRMLLGRVDRQDRLSIVREVETQIFDLLGGRDPSSLDRDDVLAVLARLDPPEAYLAEGVGLPETRSAPAPSPSRRLEAPAAGRTDKSDLISGILGLVSIIVAVLGIPLSLLLDEIGLVLADMIVFVLSLLAVIFAARVRLRGPWGVVGFVTGVISLIAALGVSVWLVLIFLS